MCARKMHADEVDTDVSLVRRLLAAQFPLWADLPIERVLSSGTDNAIYRLGDDMCVRLPRIQWAVGQVDKEHQWPRKLAPHLPLAIPVPLAKGMPTHGYPWRWSVCPWLVGEVATIERIDARQVAADLAQFIAALHRIDPTDGPPPGAHNSHRGVPLAMRDSATRTAIASLEGIIDTAVATAAWEVSLKTASWDRPPVWIHGDLMPGNLLINERGQLSAVIDFGCLGVGDPACDLMAAWTLFTGESRKLFRAALSVDDATWARGRGWALSWALIYIPYYLNSNPEGVSTAQHTINEVLADHKTARR